MTDAVSRAEFDAFARSVTARLDAIAASVADLARDLDATKEATGCTTPEGLAADKALRKFIAIWDSEGERRERADLARMLDWFRHQQAIRDDSRQRWVDLGVKTGVYSAGFGLVTGFLGGAAWVVLAVLRWINGGAP